MKYNQDCLHSAWNTTGKPDSNKHHKLILTTWFLKVNFLPAGNKSGPVHMCQV